MNCKRKSRGKADWDASLTFFAPPECVLNGLGRGGGHVRGREGGPPCIPSYFMPIGRHSCSTGGVRHATPKGFVFGLIAQRTIGAKGTGGKLLPMAAKYTNVHNAHGAYRSPDPTRPPSRRPRFYTGEKLKLTEGKGDVGHFWDTTFCPRPPPPRGGAVVQMPACHSRRFKGERPIGAATG